MSAEEQKRAELKLKYKKRMLKFENKIILTSKEKVKEKELE